MDTHTYLGRINYTGQLNLSSGVLSALQEAHLLAVPFENLDIHTGRRIVLDLPHLFRKIVTMKRGGFCYELNGLFHWLLQQLGFQSRLVMGRVYDGTTDAYGPEFDHMLMLVDVDQQTWLADVGFGDFSMHPLPFVLNRPLQDMSGQFLIEREDSEYFRVSRFSQKEKRNIPEYIFSTKERRLEEFSAMCQYHQTSPQSHFTQKKVCSIATAGGRITLTDDKLIVTDNDTRGELLIGNEEEFCNALVKNFNMTL
jgi:N-hydroxyarylamine O-acetyltransferase